MHCNLRKHYTESDSTLVQTGINWRVGSPVRILLRRLEAVVRCRVAPASECRIQRIASLSSIAAFALRQIYLS